MFRILPSFGTLIRRGDLSPRQLSCFLLLRYLYCRIAWVPMGCKLLIGSYIYRPKSVPYMASE